MVFLLLGFYVTDEDEVGHTLTETVSFSFTIGTTPIDKSSESVLTAFKYRVRCRSDRYQHQGYEREKTRQGTHVGNVTPSQQNLCDGLSKLSKEIIPKRNKSSLTNGS